MNLHFKILDIEDQPLTTAEIARFKGKRYLVEARLEHDTEAVCHSVANQIPTALLDAAVEALEIASAQRG